MIEIKLTKNHYCQIHDRRYCDYCLRNFGTVVFYLLDPESELERKISENSKFQDEEIECWQNRI